MTTYLLEDMATFIVSASSGTYVAGTNLYVGAVPDTPDEASMLLEYSGMEPLYVMGPSSLPAISQPHLQVVSRGTSYSQARADSEQIARWLETIVNTTVNTTYYLRVARLQDPFFLRRDAVKNRVYFCCNFEVMREPS